MKIISQGLLFIVLGFTSTLKFTNATEYQLSPNDDWFSVISGDDLQPGDEVILAQGTYRDASFFSISHQGTAQAPITIRAKEGDRVIMTRPDANQNVINFKGAQHLIFRGIEVKGGSTGITLGSKIIDGIKRQSRFITIENCHIHHTGGSAVTANSPGDIHVGYKFIHNEIHHTGDTGEGFYFGANNDSAGNTQGVFKDGLIEGNYIHHLNGSRVSQGDGIEIKDGSYNNIVRDNVIHNTDFPGIIVYGTDGNAPNIIEGNVIWSSGDHGIQAASDAIISNNIIFDSKGSGIRSKNHQSAIPGNLIITHNTILSTLGENAIKIGKPAGDRLSGPIVIANNALYAMGSALSLRLPDLPGFTLSQNIGTGDTLPTLNISEWNAGGNPDLDFNNWRDKDVYPAENSLLIGSASANHTIIQDFNGTLRSNSLDVGAYVHDTGQNLGWNVEPDFKEILTTIPDANGLDTDRDGIEDSQDNCIEVANIGQHDTDDDGYGNMCDGDLNNDNQTNTLDLNLYKLAHRSSLGENEYNPDADFNSDNTINTLDLNIYKKLHRKAPGPSGIIN